MSEEGSGPPVLSDPARVLLLGVFGVSSAMLIRFMGEGLIGRTDLLLMGVSVGAMVTALIWVLLLAFGRSTAWAAVMGVGVWVPYVNLVLASIFVRRYWAQGGRAPGLLGLAGMLGQTVASVRLLSPTLPTLV